MTFNAMAKTVPIDIVLKVNEGLKKKRVSVAFQKRIEFSAESDIWISDASSKGT
jgi:hypothetical protein